MEGKVMKKIYLFVICATAMISCALLEENKDSFVSPDNFYKTGSQARSGLNGCYIPLKSIYNNSFALAVEGCGDLMYCPSGTQDAQLDISPANPRFGTTMWTQGYKGVRYCNDVIYALENSDALSAQTKAPYIAEAKVLRGLYYYLLTSFFGDVPFWTEPMLSFEVQKKVQELPRMSAYATREWIVNDIKAIVDSLPAGRAYVVAQQRAGSAMAYTVMAKHAMWNASVSEGETADTWWQTASDALAKVELMYGALTEESYPLSDLRFSVKNTPESIFEIQHTYEPGGLSVTGNYACACMPYNTKHTEASAAVYDSVYVDFIGKNATPWAPYRPTQYFWDGLMPRSSKDRRMDDIMVWKWNDRFFESFLTRNEAGEVTDSTYNKTPWMGPKFWCPNMYDTKDSNNYPVFRYADVVLMQAECLCMLNRRKEAIDRLNAVKDRADIDLLLYTAFRTKEKLMEEIQRERGRELIGEFQRKFDLVRWGTWYQAVLDNNNYLKQFDVRPCHEYYPIPDSECGLSGGALKNEAYEK